MQINEEQGTPSFGGRSFLTGAGICSVLLLVLYFPVLESLVGDWIDLPDFSHGFLVPIISGYLVWERRKAFPASFEPDSRGLPLLLFGLLLFFLGKYGAEFFAQRLSLLVVACGIILFLLGWKYLKVLAFPLIFLLLMIPLPSILMDKISFPLQFISSSFAATLLDLIGIPVFREGNIIHLANTSLEVAEACSGVRSMISLLMLGILFAYFAKRIWWQRSLLVLACIPITILINTVRVSVTSLLAQAYGPWAARGFFHEFSGFVLFLVAGAMFYGFSLLLSRIAPEKK